MSVRYLGSCVEMTGSQVVSLTRMIARNREITYDTLIKHVPWQKIRKLPYFDAYDWPDTLRGDRSGLTLKRDWAVSFSKSKWRGKTCYYITHSCIEYIFVEEE